MLNRYIALESTHYRLFTKIIFIAKLGGLSVKCPIGNEISPLQKRWSDQHYHGIILVRHGWNDTYSARIYSIEGCMKKNVLAAKIYLECWKRRRFGRNCEHPQGRKVPCLLGVSYIDSFTWSRNRCNSNELGNTNPCY